VDRTGPDRGKPKIHKGKDDGAVVQHSTFNVQVLGLLRVLFVKYTHSNQEQEF
jgi:hypothetical protein